MHNLIDTRRIFSVNLKLLHDFPNNVLGFFKKSAPFLQHCSTDGHHDQELPEVPYYSSEASETEYD